METAIRGRRTHRRKAALGTGVMAVALVASLASGLTGWRSAGAEPLGGIARKHAATQLDWNDRLLDVNGPENYGR